MPVPPNPLPPFQPESVEEANLPVAKLPEAELIFDEGDALFGKRTDVQDSHDRYASVEPDLPHKP